MCQLSSGSFSQVGSRVVLQSAHFRRKNFDIMAYVQIQQDGAHFDLSVRFKVDRLRELLTAPEGVDAEPRMTTIFWPGFMFKISSPYDRDARHRKCKLSLYMLPGNTSPPTVIYATITGQALNRRT